MFVNSSANSSIFYSIPGIIRLAIERSTQIMSEYEYMTYSLEKDAVT